MQKTVCRFHLDLLTKQEINCRLFRTHPTSLSPHHMPSSQPPWRNLKWSAAVAGLQTAAWSRGGSLINMLCPSQFHSPVEDAQSLTLIRIELSSAVWHCCGRWYSHWTWHWGHMVKRNPLSWFLIENVSGTNGKEAVAFLPVDTDSHNVTLIIRPSEQRQTISFSISTRFLIVSVFLSLSASRRLSHWSEHLKAKGWVVSLTKKTAICNLCRDLFCLDIGFD